MSHTSHVRLATVLAVTAAALGAFLILPGAPQTTHPTVPATLGTPIRSTAMEALLDLPGPIDVETVASADWTASLSGLLNLEDPAAVNAGLTNRDEAIQIYVHVLRHPTFGTYLVDTGVSRQTITTPRDAGVGLVLRRFAHLEQMQPRTPTAAVVASAGDTLKGVLLTHLHLDHIAGMPDIPAHVPFYTGPGEAAERKLENFAARGTVDHFFQGRPAIEELRFTADPDGRFAGVIDVFGDRSLFAIHTPGHTEGHLSLVARSRTGAILLTGDASHTRWGWEHGVEPGTFTFDRAREKASLLALKALNRRHPAMAVRLGHQPK